MPFLAITSPSIPPRHGGERFCRSWITKRKLRTQALLRMRFGKVESRSFGATARNGIFSALRPFVGDLTKRKRVRIWLQLASPQIRVAQTTLLFRASGLSDSVVLRSSFTWIKIQAALYSVGCRLKTGQWWSIQNQPLNWLVTGLELCWQDAFWCWDGNSAGMFCG